MSAKHSKPDYVALLESVYGAPSHDGFGSAVFFEKMSPGDDLEQAAVGVYRSFVGELWERWGEEAWLGPWRQVFARQPGAAPDILAELGGIDDPEAAGSVPMLLDVAEGADAARAALAAAYDDPAVTDLRIYNLGDGGAMSGLLVAGHRAETNDGAFLVFLMD